MDLLRTPDPVSGVLLMLTSHNTMVWYLANSPTSPLPVWSGGTAKPPWHHDTPRAARGQVRGSRALKPLSAARTCTQVHRLDRANGDASLRR